MKRKKKLLVYKNDGDLLEKQTDWISKSSDVYEIFKNEFQYNLEGLDEYLGTEIVYGGEF